jgi:hypothetical protein
MHLTRERRCSAPVVDQFGFLCDLCGGSLRTLRLKSFDLREGQETLTAKYAKKGPEVAEKSKLSHYPLADLREQLCCRTVF